MGKETENRARAAAAMDAMGRQAVPARKRIILVPTEYEVEVDAEGNRTLIFRLQQPYERYDFLLPAEVAREVGAQLTAPGIHIHSPLAL